MTRLRGPWPRGGRFSNDFAIHARAHHNCLAFRTDAPTNLVLQNHSRPMIARSSAVSIFFRSVCERAAGATSISTFSTVPGKRNGDV
jgi:hypothetical protein